MIYYTDILCKSYCNSAICKNHFHIVGQIKKNWNDMAADLAQPDHSSIKRYASAFSNI